MGRYEYLQSQGARYSVVVDREVRAWSCVPGLLPGRWAKSAGISPHTGPGWEGRLMTEAKCALRAICGEITSSPMSRYVLAQMSHQEALKRQMEARVDVYEKSMRLHEARSAYERNLRGDDGDDSKN